MYDWSSVYGSIQSIEENVAIGVKVGWNVSSNDTILIIPVKGDITRYHVYVWNDPHAYLKLVNMPVNVL